MIKLQECPQEWVLGAELPKEHFKNGLPVVLLVVYHGDQFFLPEKSKVLPDAEVYVGESVAEGIRRAFVTHLGFKRRDIPIAPWELVGCLTDESLAEAQRRVLLIRYVIPEKHRLVPGPGVEGEWIGKAQFEAMLPELVPNHIFCCEEHEVERLAA